jgi:hypothetical protein
MENLGKENFWDAIRDRYPEGFIHFTEWVDRYKEEIGWDKIFAPGVKFHDVPLDIQNGIIARFDLEKHNGKEAADRIRANLPHQIKELIDEVHTRILMNKSRKHN